MEKIKDEIDWVKAFFHFHQKTTMYHLHRIRVSAVILLILPVSSAFLGQLRRTPNIAISSTKVDGVEIEVHDLQSELNTADLNLCHGVLHAAGIREIKDLINLTEEQIADMRLDTFDQRNILRVKDKLNKSSSSYASNTQRVLSTQRHGAFDRKVLSRFEVEEKHDFSMQTICSDNEVYKGVLFNVEQCGQLNRMSEHHAYSQIGVINGGWSDQIYTLTAQHMACKVRW